MYEFDVAVELSVKFGYLYTSHSFVLSINCQLPVSVLQICWNATIVSDVWWWDCLPGKFLADVIMQDASLWRFHHGEEGLIKAEIDTLKTKNKDTPYFQVLKATKILMSTNCSWLNMFWSTGGPKEQVQVADHHPYGLGEKGTSFLFLSPHWASCHGSLVLWCIQNLCTWSLMARTVPVNFSTHDIDDKGIEVGEKQGSKITSPEKHLLYVVAWLFS